MAIADVQPADGNTEVLLQSEAVLSPVQKRFYASEHSNEARAALEAIVDNPRYNTESSYYSTSDLDFIDRHLYYLSTHPTVNLLGYITNLKLMTSSRNR